MKHLFLNAVFVLLFLSVSSACSDSSSNKTLNDEAAKSNASSVTSEASHKKEPVMNSAALSESVKAQSGFQLKPYDRYSLPNGMTVQLMQKTDIPMVGIDVRIKGGAVTDPAGQAGLSSLLASLMEKGAGDRDATAFAETIESVGGHLSISGGREALRVNGDFLSADADLMLELTADMLQRPTLAKHELDKLTSRQINLIVSAKDGDPRQLVSTYGHQFLFTKHPYASPAGGTESSLEKITLADIKQTFTEQVGADRCILTVVGDFDSDKMKTAIQQHFSNWNKASTQLPEFDKPGKAKGKRVLLVHKPESTQTYFWIGNTGVATDYEKRAALNLANTVFGGRFTSMLNTELRVKSGLTYGARSTLTQYQHGGSVAMNSFTKTDSTKQAMDLALDTYRAFLKKGLDAEALQSAKNYVLGQYAPRYQTAEQLAGALGTLASEGLSDEYINAYAKDILAVDAAAIKSVITDVYPAESELVFVMIGDADKVRDIAAEYGEVSEIKITDAGFGG